MSEPVGKRALELLQEIATAKALPRRRVEWSASRRAYLKLVRLGFVRQVPPSATNPDYMLALTPRGRQLLKESRPAK